MGKTRRRHAKHDSPLYLRKATIRNVRCFEKIEFDLESDGSPRMWGVVFGDNGVGKTSLLRCIAMGLCDAASAAGLLREVYGEWNRQVAGTLEPAEIRLEFFPTDGTAGAHINTKIIPSRSGYSQISQRASFPEGSSKTRDFPWDRIFACGYGAARRAFGTKDIDDYATVDAVYSLFTQQSAS